MELIILIGVIVFIAWAIGSSSSGKEIDYKHYNQDWNREYNKWKFARTSDKEARRRASVKVNKNKQSGKYDKY